MSDNNTGYDYTNGTSGQNDNNSGTKTPKKGGGWWKIALAAICLAYIIVPTDLLPDFLPVIGQIDDLGALVGMVSSIVAAVKGFKIGRATAQDDDDINDVESN